MQKMKFSILKRILIVLLLLTGTTHIEAFNTQNIIREGNELYKKGHYSQAATKYQQVADSGYIASDLFYNLGSAYFKANDNKRAILYYEKARLLNPRDKELNYNLDLARTKVVDKIQNIPDLFFMEWIRTFRDQFAVDSWSSFSITLFVIGLAGFLVYFFTYQMRFRKTGFWVGSLCVFLAILSFLFATSAYNSQIKQRTAIVFVKAVTIKSTPSETGTNLFILHEGTKVRIIDKVEDWLKIKIPDGNQGWIKENDLAKI
jgi:tetratricopeptide (TPR) repeat protein